MWQTRNFITLCLLPVASLFCLIVQIRRAAYRDGFITSCRLPVPVIIVGNISVGGTGKTPLVIWLTNYLRTEGWQPGVIIRGYRGKAKQWPQFVEPHSDPQQVGDEAVLLARRCGCPVVAAPNRFIAGQWLIQKYARNIIICDDGLQHYALQRDVEIAVIDGEKRLGNGLCLPAGPLRELPQRLHTCDLVITNGQAAAGEFSMILHGTQAVKLGNSLHTKPLTEFVNHDITAIAGIGNPSRFFAMLKHHGLRLQERAFPDHHAFCMQDFAGLTSRTIMMTEKDAVKCEQFLHHVDAWYVPINAVLEPVLVTKFARISQLLKTMVA